MHSMLKKDFWYDLPKELIAQEPASPRDAARLMVLSQKDDSIRHKVFRDLPEFLEPGDLLVVNNSKVLPARIVGVKQPTGAVCELLLLRQVKGDQWECLAKPGKRMQPGTKVSFGDGSLTAVVDETMEDGNKYVTFYYDTETLYEKLDEFGKMPLPPYITKQLEDQSQYQTVYAKELGSAAAPTAGLHFTPELLDTIQKERAHYYSMIQERGDIFTEEAKQCGLKMLPYISGFFLSIPAKDPEAVCNRLHEDNIFCVPLAAGVRVAVCGVPKHKVYGMAAKIKAAMDAVGED